MVTNEVRPGGPVRPVTSREVIPAPSRDTRPRRQLPPHLKIFACLFILTATVSVISVFLLEGDMGRRSLFDLANFTGPTTLSLLHGGGLAFCSDSIGFGAVPICFHAARMPVATLTVAAGVLLFGDSFLQVSLFKIVLFLLPLEFAIFLVCRRLPQSRTRRMVCALLLIAPFAMTIFVANVVNLQVEEDYAYSLLACAFAMILFGPEDFRDDRASHPFEDSPARGHLAYLIFFALIVDGLFLSKSSMSPAVAVLTAAFFLQQRRAASRVLLLALVAAAPLGWALHQHHASGRYSIGTSLDGMNLHKGNGVLFLEHYPPPPPTSLDDYDPELNRGLALSNEWALNDYHLHAAITYIRSHPRETLQGEWRKFRLLYVSLTKYGASRSLGLKLVMEKAGLLLFRLLFWTAIGYSLLALLTPARRALRVPAATYIALVAACALPYLIGFGYTRHASILIYPACLMWCRILCVNAPRR